MSSSVIGWVSLLTDDSGLQVHKHCSGDVLASSRFAEESVEAVVSSSHSLVRGHLAVRLDPVFQAVELPAGIAHLGASLAHVDRQTLALPTEQPPVFLVFTYSILKIP